MEHDVLGLDVPVDETLLVYVVHSFQDLLHDPLALHLRHVQLCLEEGEQLATATSLHDDVVGRIILDHVIQAKHVRVRIQIEHPVQQRPPDRLTTGAELLVSHLHDHILLGVSACRPDDLGASSSGLIKLLLGTEEVLERFGRPYSPDLPAGNRVAALVIIELVLHLQLRPPSSLGQARAAKAHAATALSRRHHRSEHQRQRFRLRCRRKHRWAPSVSRGMGLGNRTRANLLHGGTLQHSQGWPPTEAPCPEPGRNHRERTHRRGDRQRAAEP
mmetsp:Transcript_116885/g.372165  ORF Transcript_116885/g.372165 Transcript_116885/m.372165 type:complete len:273 (-) Transcript_116885:2-820(-)